MNNNASGSTAPAPARRRLARRRARGSSLDPHETRRALLLVAPAVAVLALVIGYPVARAVYMSFQADQHLDENGVFVEGGFAGLDNYKHWLLQRCGDVACPPGSTGSSFWEVVWITLFFTVVTVTIELVLGFWFAMIMNGKFRGRGLVRAAVLIPWAIPTAVTAKLWYFIFSYDGIINNLFNSQVLWFGDKWAARSAIIVSDVWKTTPFMALLILAGLQLIADDVYEAAKVDGASPWQRFWSITVPLVKPAVVVALLFRTLDVLRMYDLPQIMTGGGAGDGNDTTTLSILVINEIRNGFNSAAALSTLTFLLVFGVAFLFIKFLGASATGAEGKAKR
ncbi:carbohydrate ABC transporter permease [Nocardioides cavernaquae]|uniref:Sugar ABC transporter permease n=1 Tax=Nocardioides cavernaquae TaxID=2321396 RepID=A0A3A5H5G5_9ACTN|nr:sugar ABC transporter permease [Nocardioides cavernaquae]RJS45933.1 sugar ABC transporter permease [Nocardioides cavernaquae]